jgi:hypothetical protein
MNRLLLFFALGALFAATTSVLIFKGMSQERHIEALLRLPERDLMSRSEEIERLEGATGKALLALLACIGWKSQAVEKIQACEGDSKSAGATELASGDAHETVPPRPSSAPLGLPPAPAFDAHSFFCRQARGIPQRVDADKWDAIFRAEDGFQPERQTLFGYVETLEGSTADSPATWLDERVCQVPVLWKMTEHRRQQGSFFRGTRARVYEGPITLLAPAAPKPGLRMHLHFNARLDEPEREYWVAFQDTGRRPEDLYENRVVSYKTTHPVWRVNPCSGSVTLLNDHCPWSGDEYDAEIKDLFYVSSMNQVWGNFYCRKRKDKTWVRLGRAELHPSSG